MAKRLYAPIPHSLFPIPKKRDCFVSQVLQTTFGTQLTRFWFYSKLRCTLTNRYCLTHNCILVNHLTFTPTAELGRRKFNYNKENHPRKQIKKPGFSVSQKPGFFKKPGFLTDYLAVSNHRKKLK